MVLGPQPTGCGPGTGKSACSPEDPGGEGGGGETISTVNYKNTKETKTKEIKKNRFDLCLAMVFDVCYRKPKMIVGS